MGCNCGKTKMTTVTTENKAQPTPVITEPEKKVLPTEQCIACAQKHMDEAYMLFMEYGYSRENARLCRGNIRAIVLHTYKDFPDIAKLARECALKLQNGTDATKAMKNLCNMIDDAYDKKNKEESQS